MTDQTHNTDPKVLQLPIIFGMFFMAFLNFALPIYGKTLGASALEIGGLFSILALVMTCLRPVVGWAMDRWGRKPFLISALLCYAVAMLVFAFANDIVGMYVAQVLRGLGSAMMWITAYTIATELSVKGRQGESVGVVDESAGRGMLFGGMFGFTWLMLLPQDVGWKVATLGYAGFCLAGIWLTWKRVPETRPQEIHAEKDDAPINPQLYKLMVIVFFTALSTSMLAPLFIIFMQDRFTVDTMIIIIATMPAGIAASLLPTRLGRLSDRFGRAPMMAAGLAAAGLISIIMPNLPGVLWFAIVYALESAGWALSSPAEEAMVADLTGRRTRGRGYGLYTAASSLGMVVGPLVGGWLYDHFGHASPFYLNAAVLLSASVLVFILFRVIRPTLAVKAVK